MSAEYHIPVLSHEAVELLINPELSNRTFVDGTLGAGGYASLICKLTGPSDKIIGIDKDLNAIMHAGRQLEFCSDRLKIVEGNFADVDSILGSMGVKKISGIVLDLGLSSYQLEHEDGFSYLRDTVLDMRASAKGDLTAADVLNTYDAKRLEELFESYGELGKARRLANAIVNKRRLQRFETTLQLSRLIETEYKISKKNRMDFLSKIFQALRIEVNNEIENLGQVLGKSLELLEPGGRIVIVSYHSLEDRMVKNFFREHSRKDPGLNESKLKLLTKKPVTPDKEEIRTNRRSRSAKLRAAEKNRGNE